MFPAMERDRETLPCQPSWAGATAHLSRLSGLPRKLLSYIKIHPGNPKGILRMECAFKLECKKEEKRKEKGRFASSLISGW